MELDWSALFGAVIGAVVGGGIAYLIQRQELNAARTQREEDWKRTQEALALSLLFKLGRLYTDVHEIHRLIEEQYADIEKDHIEPWQHFVFYPNLPEPVEFSSDEMGMLLGLKSDDLFNRMSSLDVEERSLVALVNNLNSERRMLASKTPPDVFAGNIMGHAFDKQQYTRLRPDMINVNSSMELVRSEASRIHEKVYVALPEYNTLIQDKLGLKQKLELVKTPADVKAKQGGQPEKPSSEETNS